MEGLQGAEQWRVALDLFPLAAARCIAAATLARLCSHDHWPLQLRYRLLCGAAIAVDGVPRLLSALMPRSRQQRAPWTDAAASVFDASAQTLVRLLLLIDADGLPPGQGGPPAGSLGSLLWAIAAAPPKLLGCLHFLGHCSDYLLYFRE